MLLLAALLAACAPRPPNVIVYVVDTLRADSIAVYGNAIVATPAVDALADDGVLFERAYAPSSWTRPSVASMLTGVYPDALGMAGRRDVLAEELVLLSERFARAGYATGAVLTNPNVGAVFGFDQGFETFLELYARRRPGRVRSEELIARSDRVTRVARRWIDQARQPFFLLLLTVDPHYPYAPALGFDRYRSPTTATGATDAVDLERERTRMLYYGEVTFNDESFGRLVEHLVEHRLWDDTIVVFASDHGEEFWEHGHLGHGRALFEESIRVPLVIRAPGRLPAGVRVEAPVETVDVFPTLLELADLPVPDAIDGRSLVTLGAGPERKIYATLDLDGHRARSVVASRWKLISPLDGTPGRLFDLSADPAEQRSLTDAHPETAERLAAWLDERGRQSALLRARRGPTATVEPGALPDRTRRGLEALGYLTADPTSDR